MHEPREPASLTADAAPPRAAEILVRYGELSLKRGNRHHFEKALCRNIEAATESISPVRIERLRGRFSVVPERRVEEVARRLQDVFGIKSVSPVWAVRSDPAEIVALARTVLLDALAAFRPGEEVTFRVQTRRADKSFPMESNDFDRYLADHILEGVPDIRVQMRSPALTLGVEIRERGTYVFVHQIPGLGGLPVGTTGRALCLLSGGIDSPVAAWLGMKRGLSVSFVTFHSFPFIGEESKRKVLELACQLARYQPKSRLYVVPFAAIQTAIRDQAPEGYRTILYRRMMQRIAARIAAEYGLTALITGESLGQVASQTLENIECIAGASTMTVLRPLITYDKEDTILLARKIGTFDISNRQEPDCCTVFMPARPVIRGKASICRAVEAEMDVEALVAEAIAKVEIHEVVARP